MKNPGATDIYSQLLRKRLLSFHENDLRYK
jgi:hypothetical protein